MGGEEAVNSGGSHSGGMGGDIFSMFTGQNQSRNTRQRTKDVSFELNVTLEDIYAGKTKKLNIER